MAATGKGNREATPFEAFGEKAPIDWADEPAKVVVENENPIVVRDNGVYGDMIRALSDSKNPDNQYRRWAMWKNGIGWTDIAKSEHPEWVTEYGQEAAQKKYDSEADTIRHQVQRMENKMNKKK